MSAALDCRVVCLVCELVSLAKIVNSTFRLLNFIILNCAAIIKFKYYLSIDLGL